MERALGAEFDVVGDYFADVRDEGEIHENERGGEIKEQFVF